MQDIPHLTDADKARIVALGTAATAPASGFEKHFVGVLEGIRRPATRMERAWLLYWNGYNAGQVESRRARETIQPRANAKESARVRTPLNRRVIVVESRPRSRNYDSWEANYRRLKSELASALSRTDAQDIKAWAESTVRTFGSSAIRRISTLAGTVSRLGTAIFDEIVKAGRAISEGRGRDHFVAIGDRVSLTSKEFKDSATLTFDRLAAMIKNDPSNGATKILGAALGFMAGSGGADANGGAPDLDISLMGIDAHRSILTHSILIGVIIETAVISLIDLNRRVHKNLPRKHDQFWDNLLTNSERIADAFSRGASTGVAYHLFVDSTFQPGAYHDLGLAMPIEAHQAILMTNAIAEGLDAAKRKGVAYQPKTSGGKAVEKTIEAVEVVSGKAAEFASYAVAYAQGFTKGLLGK